MEFMYDLLLKGGHVIDPKNNINEKMDVAVKDKKMKKSTSVRASSKSVLKKDVLKKVCA